MINRLFLYESPSVDPYYNLAVEQHLLEAAAADSVILYLWQNQNTVVIGKNQNPWKECKTTLLSEEGGHLARRLSGGGAVFHDLGNLNFTFLVPQCEYDLTRQFRVIMEAVGSFGIDVRLSGRNDVLANGRKFSGNAFYKNGTQAYHHGTLLVDVDKEKMGRYLNPSKLKLRSKGVDSVRSRVVNLRELIPDITVDALKQAMSEAFAKVYGLRPQRLEESMLDGQYVARLTARNRGWEWNYGAKMPFTASWEDRFPWGGIQIDLQIENGIIQGVKVYSDAMNWAIAPVLEQCLSGCRFEAAALRRRLASCALEEKDDILALLTKE